MNLKQDPLESDFTDLSTNDFIVEMNHLADCQEPHPAYQPPVPEYVTLAPEIRQMGDGLGKARDAAAGGDKGWALEQKARRDAAQLALSMNALHLTMLSLIRKDPSILDGAGYPFKQKAVHKHAVNLLDLEPRITAKHGGTSGFIIIMVYRAQTKASVELRMALQDPGNEASYFSKGIYNKSRIELKDLEPAQRIYLSARYHEDGNTGAWTKPIDIIVL